MVRHLRDAIRIIVADYDGRRRPLSPQVAEALAHLRRATAGQVPGDAPQTHDQIVAEAVRIVRSTSA